MLSDSPISASQTFGHLLSPRMLSGQRPGLKLANWGKNASEMI